MTNPFKFAIQLMLLALALVAAPSVAHATPVLQVYIEGATYNTETETWDFESTDGTAEIVILAALDPGETLSDVNLVVAYGSENTGAELSLMADGGTELASTSGSDSTPDGLSAHGIYGAGTSYVEFSLGDFSGDAGDTAWNTTDGDGQTNGDVRAYSLGISGIEGTIHLDAYGTNDSGKVKFAPYSHDGAITAVPELSARGAAPAGTLLLGLLLLVASRRRQQLAL